MDTVLTFQFQAKDLAKNDTQLEDRYIEMIGRLSLRYNQVAQCPDSKGPLSMTDHPCWDCFDMRACLLCKGLESLPTRISPHHSDPRWVKTYDFPKLWLDMTKDPKKVSHPIKNIVSMTQPFSRADPSVPGWVGEISTD